MSWMILNKKSNSFFIRWAKNVICLSICTREKYKPKHFRKYISVYFSSVLAVDIEVESWEIQKQKTRRRKWEKKELAESESEKDTEERERRIISHTHTIVGGVTVPFRVIFQMENTSVSGNKNQIVVHSYCDTELFSRLTETIRSSIISSYIFLFRSKRMMGSGQWGSSAAQCVEVVFLSK